uniref:Maturase K n=2 Tax=Porella TaxID=56942 RepID=Q6EMJ8_9MARC|nr:maturase [Porella baueri]AAT68873.1 maturase [Porella cordaeana]
MSTIKAFSTIRELEDIRESSFWEQRFLYPLLFQDDLYGVAHNRFIYESRYRKNKNYGLDNEFNFLTLKRLIRKSRQSNFSWIVSNQFIKKFQVVQEILIIIFDFIIPPRPKSFIEKSNEWNSYQSLHSIFPFMEDHIYNSNIGLDITIPYSFHPEILIRIFRRYILDISFLHLLRLLLHQNEIVIISNPYFDLRKNQFYNLLWNFHIHKFEYSLISIWKQFYNFQSNSFWFFLNQTNLIQKIQYISEQSNFVTMEKIIGKNCSIQYARYRNNLIITTNGNITQLIKNWNTFFIFFWEKYFHFWFEPYRVFVKDLSKKPICFLGYIFRTESKSTIIQIQLVNDSINVNSITKEFCGIIPIVPLIILLARERFCDTSGRPICKLSWTTLADNEIFKQFDQITKNIFRYYSGCIKKKGLYQLQYILRFSCAKTLACKHKSTIRTVWKRYGSNFVTNSLSLKKKEWLFSNSWRIKYHVKKIWYLDIIRINYLANLLQRLKKVQDS